MALKERQNAKSFSSGSVSGWNLARCKNLQLLTWWEFKFQVLFSRRSDSCQEPIWCCKDVFCVHFSSIQCNSNVIRVIVDSSIIRSDNDDVDQHLFFTFHRPIPCTFQTTHTPLHPRAKVRLSVSPFSAKRKEGARVLTTSRWVCLTWEAGARIVWWQAISEGGLQRKGPKNKIKYIK